MKKFWAVGLALIVSVISSRGATTYFGPNYDQATPAIGSGAVNGGKLSLNNNVNTVSTVFTKGIGSFSDVLVIFIDSGPGGFAGTGGFTDNSDSLQRAISGLNSAGTSRATANFVSGFTADYAIAIGGDLGARVYQLVNGGSFVEVRNLHGGFGGVNESSYSFGFDWVDIGLTSGSGNGFTFE